MIHALRDTEPITNARSRSSEKGQHVTPYTGNGIDSLRDLFPTFRAGSIAFKKLNSRKKETNTPEFCSVIPPQGLVPVHRHYRDDDQLALLNPITENPANASQARRRAYGMESCNVPLVSLNGCRRGITSSLPATRANDGTGGFTLRVSRMTQSRYGSAFISSTVGVSVEAARSSSRSFFWTLGCRQRKYNVHVTAAL